MADKSRWTSREPLLACSLSLLIMWLLNLIGPTFHTICSALDPMRAAHFRTADPKKYSHEASSETSPGEVQANAKPPDEPASDGNPLSSQVDLQVTVNTIAISLCGKALHGAARVAGGCTSIRGCPREPRDQV